VWGLHPIGKPYEFVVKATVVRITYDSIKWPTKIANPPIIDRVAEVIKDSASLPSPLLCHSVKLDSDSVSPSVDSLEQAVSLSIPKHPHQNNAKLFTLARALLTLEINSGEISHQEKNRAFGLWYDDTKQLGFLRHELSRDDYRMEFLNALKTAKIPIGKKDELVRHAWAAVQSETMPAEDLGFSDQRIIRFIALCRQMECLSDGQPWFISTRDAADLIGVSRTVTAQWYRALTALGVLEVKQPPTARHATRYRFKRE
jgi:hypothetical protein